MWQAAWSEVQGHAGWHFRAAARLIRRTPKAVLRRMERLAVARGFMGGRIRPWTPAEDARVLGWNTSRDEMARSLRRTTKAVERRLWRLKRQGRVSRSARERQLPK